MNKSSSHLLSDRDTKHLWYLLLNYAELGSRRQSAPPSQRWWNAPVLLLITLKKERIYYPECLGRWSMEDEFSLGLFIDMLFLGICDRMNKWPTYMAIWENFLMSLR